MVGFSLDIHDDAVGDGCGVQVRQPTTVAVDDSCDVGVGLDVANADDAGLARDTLVADVNVVVARRKVVTGEFSQRDVAAAAGVVQRAVGNGGWNGGMGNHITILHSNGTVTYYGHLMTLLVKSGDKVYTGQNIAFMGGAPGMAGAGNSTGCHVHFEVIGARNPLAGYAKGATISYK